MNNTGKTRLLIERMCSKINDGRTVSAEDVAEMLDTIRAWRDLSDARVAAAYEAVADARSKTSYSIYGADRTDAYAKGYCGGIEKYHNAIRALTPADATAALETALKRARNEALEDVIEYLNKQAERYHDHFHAQKQRFDRGAFVALQEAASDICAMKEQPHD